MFFEIIIESGTWNKVSEYVGSNPIFAAKCEIAEWLQATSFQEVFSIHFV